MQGLREAAILLLTKDLSMHFFFLFFLFGRGRRSLQQEDEAGGCVLLPVPIGAAAPVPQCPRPWVSCGNAGPGDSLFSSLCFRVLGMCQRFFFFLPSPQLPKSAVERTVTNGFALFWFGCCCYGFFFFFCFWFVFKSFLTLSVFSTFYLKLPRFFVTS